jgi:CheY-like chemotaxis protein
MISIIANVEDGSILNPIANENVPVVLPVKNKCILQVEDDENDVFMLQHVFKRTGIPCPLQVVRDGQDAIDYLQGVGLHADRLRSPLPCLILLDLNLPTRSGFEVLKWIRQHPPLRKLVVVVFSSSALAQDVGMAYELGANSYIVKPTELPKLVEIGQLLKGWWLGYNQFAPIDEKPESSNA